MKALFIPADEDKSAHVVELSEEDPYKLAKYFIDGWATTVHIPFEGYDLYVDEDGLLKGLPYNRRATEFSPGVGKLVGDAIIIRSALEYDSNREANLKVRDMSLAMQNRFLKFIGEYDQEGS